MNRLPEGWAETPFKTPPGYKTHITHIRMPSNSQEIISTVRHFTRSTAAAVIGEGDPIVPLLLMLTNVEGPIRHICEYIAEHGQNKQRVMRSTAALFGVGFMDAELHLLYEKIGKQEPTPALIQSLHPVYTSMSAVAAMMDKPLQCDCAMCLIMRSAYHRLTNASNTKEANAAIVNALKAEVEVVEHRPMIPPSEDNCIIPQIKCLMEHKWQLNPDKGDSDTKQE